MNFTDDEVLSCSATKGDLLVCEGGAGYGRSAIWSKDYDICLQNHIHRLRPYVFGICEYVYYFIYLLKESNRLASVGTAMPGLSANRLKSLIIPLPPLQEQARIVAKLEEVNHLIERYGAYESDFSELNSAINGLLHKSILQEAIQGKLVPQIESEGTAQELLEQMQQEKLRLVKEGVLKKSTLASSVIFKGDDNKYYMKSGNESECIDESLPFSIPTTWRWVTLGELINDITGLSYKKELLSDKSDNMVRVLRGGNIEDGKMFLKPDDVMISAQYVPENLYLQKNTFITPAVSSLEKIGKTALILNDLDNVVVGGFVLMLIPTFNNIRLVNYLYYFFQTSYYHNYCKLITKKSGQAFYNLSRQKLKQCLVPIPPNDELSRILSRLDDVLASIMRK
jgi:type I restriction enzyme S subunit